MTCRPSLASTTAYLRAASLVLSVWNEACVRVFPLRFRCVDNILANNGVWRVWPQCSSTRALAAHQNPAARPLATAKGSCSHTAMVISAKPSIPRWTF